MTWEKVLVTDWDLEVFGIEGIDEGIKTDEILGKLSIQSNRLKKKQNGRKGEA